MWSDKTSVWFRGIIYPSEWVLTYCIKVKVLRKMSKFIQGNFTYMTLCVIFKISPFTDCVRNTNFTPEVMLRITALIKNKWIMISISYTYCFPQHFGLLLKYNLQKYNYSLWAVSPFFIILEDLSNFWKL